MVDAVVNPVAVPTHAAATALPRRSWERSQDSASQAPMRGAHGRWLMAGWIPRTAPVLAPNQQSSGGENMWKTWQNFRTGT